MCVPSSQGCGERVRCDEKNGEEISDGTTWKLILRNKKTIKLIIETVFL